MNSQHFFKKKYWSEDPILVLRGLCGFDQRQTKRERERERERERRTDIKYRY